VSQLNILIEFIICFANWISHN